jgi:hypothetical protein
MTEERTKIVRKRGRREDERSAQEVQRKRIRRVLTIIAHIRISPVRTFSLKSLCLAAQVVDTHTSLTR